MTERLKSSSAMALEAALVELESGPTTNDPNGPIVDSLARRSDGNGPACLEHVGKRLQGTIAGACDRPTAAALSKSASNGLPGACASPLFTIISGAPRSSRP